MNKLYNIFIKRKGFIIYSLLKILILILSFVTNIFIIRKLTVSNYGVFSVALMFVGLLTTFGFSWSSSSILYYGSREKEKTGSLNKTFWARNIIIGISLIFTTLIFILFRNQINNYIGLDVSWLILIWLYVSVAEDYLMQYFLTIKKQMMSSMLSVTAKFIYLLMILLFSFDVKTLIIMNIISHSTVLLYIIGIDKSDIGKFEFDKSWFKEIFNFSMWQLFGFSGLYLINFGDTAVINHFLDIEDVGIYNAAFKLFNSIANLSFVISSYYAGAVSRYFINKESSNIKFFFYRERFLISGLSTFVHLIIIFLSKPLITFFYGIEYIDSILIFNILMIGSIFRYLSVFYMLYYNTNGKYKLLQYINIVRALINVGLNIILVNYWGLIGVAIATTIAIIITFFISMLYCEKRIFKLTKENGTV
ncbi:oligosaccharide flippase family protein [Amphibacillus sp. MSJ-3]|uniref:lipopolysaccharide biosynthesis protein n=1 Tax=Amphibacillus sp. MSJ-3 TaxID=2841505 RepID=UPI001C0EAAED|nr:oligosaccharide flippase family protein [Amphibacillus sp. MSJ-3]MBU5594398.1 oligosaccharide flippase family protein [Amphibacillus sp. MSJ-3]